MKDSKSIQSIQLLRAIAVLLVVHCHVLDFQLYNRRIALQQQFFHLQNFGAAGVDIFFVISGFIITVISSKYVGGNTAIFFVKRLLRVVPLYWLATLLIGLFSHFYWGKVYDGPSIVTTLVFFPFLNPVPAANPVLFQGWTLSFELLFYSITTLAMLTSNKKYMLFTGSFFAVCILLRYGLGFNNVFLHFAGNGIMAEFIYGTLAGILYLSAVQWRPLAASLVWIFGTVLFFAGIVWGYGYISEAPGTINGLLSVQRSILWGIPAALLVAGLAMREKAKPFRVPGLWMAIGNASYSIYLLHPFLLRFIYNRHFDISFNGWLPPDLQVLLGMFVATTGGYIFYRVIERPLLRWLSKVFSTSKSRQSLTQTV